MVVVAEAGSLATTPPRLPLAVSKRLPFAVAALSQMSWQELVRAFRDLIAWDNTRLADLERQLRREREAKADQPAAS